MSTQTSKFELVLRRTKTAYTVGLFLANKEKETEVVLAIAQRTPLLKFSEMVAEILECEIKYDLSPEDFERLKKQ